MSLHVKVIVRQRRILRFLRAKQNAAQLVQLMKRLEWTQLSFTVSVLRLDYSGEVLMSLVSVVEDDVVEC